MTMIEQVAAAIKASGAYCPDWQGSDDDLLIMARAAIEAMREPTEVMAQAGAAARRDWRESPWRVMIDAALGE